MTPVEEKAVAAFLAQTRVFGSCSGGELADFARAHGDARTYEKGEMIFSGGVSPAAMCLLLKGRARVTRGNAVLSVLEPGELFGAVTLFAGKQQRSTDIRALTHCRTVFFGREPIEKLMETNRRMALDYIEYLSERVFYLTGKIEAYTAGSVESKLAGYLLKNASTGADDRLRADIGNLSALARLLGVGRASLYRALDKLESEQTVYRIGKTVFITGEEAGASLT
ncbi:MAG TPA: Crp/Fnr family transcriptional regulator [Clostridiales bacterium]|nr:MAG: DNA-binding transcriptional dual regulator Crp [Firmicutes bacterium ADurb.Bin262]HOU10411.1 Crp/Fnr family transcriptional regulator [Clostridiales bacterium]HQH64497.1 Crp/Fnr family transcriptional regulator [Clostridiales bacterium]HQK73605.1 Crp/Fnr family transcriptional regulator [Clostridiales bacterium]